MLWLLIRPTPIRGSMLHGRVSMIGRVVTEVHKPKKGVLKDLGFESGMIVTDIILYICFCQISE